MQASECLVALRDGLMLLHDQNLKERADSVGYDSKYLLLLNLAYKIRRILLCAYATRLPAEELALI